MAQKGPDKKAAAKEKFLEAKALIENEEYKAAIAALEASYELSPAPVVLYNIAICYRSLNMYTDAVKHMKLYIEKTGAKLSKLEKKEVEVSIAEMEKFIGKVVITSEPGAGIELNGKAVGTGPTVEVPLDAGEYKVEVKKEGFTPFEQKVIVAPGKETKIEAKLEPLPPPQAGQAVLPAAGAGKKEEGGTGSLLLVDSAQKESIVTVDDKVWGKVPVTQAVEPGAHVVRITAKEYEAWEKPVTVGEGDKVILDVSLFKAGPAAAGKPKKKGGAEKWMIWTAAVVSALVGGGLAAAIAVPVMQDRGGDARGSLDTKYPE